MKAEWPKPIDEATLASFGATAAHAELTEAKCELIRAVRAMRASYNIPTNSPLDIYVAPTTAEAAEFLTRDSAALKSLLSAATLTVKENCKPEGPCGTAVSTIATAYIPLAGVIDLDAEVKRLEKQEAEITKYLESIRKKLSNQNFVARAPKEIVEAEKAKIAEFEEKLARVREQMKAYK